MTTICMISILLFSQILRFDLLVWMVGIPVLIIAVITLIFQHRQYKRITAEQQQLLKVKRNAIEYDLVLKTMKLTVWRILSCGNPVLMQASHNSTIKPHATA